LSDAPDRRRQTVWKRQEFNNGSEEAKVRDPKPWADSDPGWARVAWSQLVAILSLKEPAVAESNSGRKPMGRSTCSSCHLAQTGGATARELDEEEGAALGIWYIRTPSHNRG